MSNKKEKMSASDIKKHKFVEEYYKNGYNATQAYLAVFNPKNAQIAASSASRLLSSEKVQQIVAEIEAAEVDKAIVTKEEIIKSNLEIRDEAQAAGRYGDAIKANSEIARLTGMYEPDKVESKSEIKFDFGLELDEE